MARYQIFSPVFEPKRMVQFDADNAVDAMAWAEEWARVNCALEIELLRLLPDVEWQNVVGLWIFNMEDMRR